MKDEVEGLEEEEGEGEEKEGEEFKTTRSFTLQ